MKLAIAAALAATLAAAPAGAAPTFQVTGGSGQRATTIGYGQPLGQTFTATGTTLSSFGFQFRTLNPGFADLPVTLSIYAGDAPTGAALASTTLTPTGIPAMTYGATGWVDFAIGAALTPGQTYTAALTSSTYLYGLVFGPDINIYTAVPLAGDAYAGGHLFQTLPYTDSICATGICDANFRYTITGAATATAVPEPASWALMLGGVGLAGGALRRRRRLAASSLAPA